MLGHVAGAAVRVVVEDDVALLEGVEPELLDRPLDRELDRADLRRAELGLRDHVPRRVEDDAREVERLVEDRRVGRRHHRHAHVAAAARQIVVDHVSATGSNVVVVASCVQLPSGSRARPASCARRSCRARRTSVEPSSSITAGPAIGSPGSSEERCATVARRTRGRGRTPGRSRAREARSRRCAPREVQRRPLADHGHLEADELDHLAVDRVAVALGMERRRSGGTLARAPPRPARRSVDLDLVLVVLPEVAHVDRPQRSPARRRSPPAGARRAPRSVIRSNCRFDERARPRHSSGTPASTPCRRGCRRAAGRAPRRRPGAAARSPSECRATRATAAACSGPAPPNASSEKRRGSWPRSSETILIALAMFSFAISTIDAASSSGARPMRLAERLHRLVTADGVEAHPPGEEVVGVEAAEHARSRR